MYWAITQLTEGSFSHEGIFEEMHVYLSHYIGDEQFVVSFMLALVHVLRNFDV